MTASRKLQCFRVGGSVRDELMGLPAGDRDWVVVGATPGQMIAQGFQPVGKDFPVFLHPKTHEEYALARTERKTGPGYKGFSVQFSPDVSLEDDLLRRDLTINAMAMTDGGELIDPFDGRQDLQQRVFRHVSPAFREDPVRILRIARFAARFPDFVVADETMALMRDMSAAGEVDALVAERVWQEISRGLMSVKPSRLLQVLDDSGALAILLPPLAPVSRRPGWLQALDDSAALGDPLPVRFAIMMAAATDIASAHHPDPVPSTIAAAVENLARGLRASNECIDAAQRLAGEMPGSIPGASRHWWLDPARLAPAGLLALFNRHDAWRRPERLGDLLQAALRLATADDPSHSFPVSASSPSNPRPAPITNEVTTSDGETAAESADTGPDRDAKDASLAVHHILPTFPNQPPVYRTVLARIDQALAASRAVDTGSIAREHANAPKAIRAAIERRRLQAIEELGPWQNLVRQTERA
ncbi:MAG: multifunctional CCA tRNA nucleotidyl transferase/2'3'-cyclic phosphodiesterase/2'nucleotidase/phosphatase [Lautropia sp.]|nr:multifunctional CCA tRNA nucleotidyl transferase/2'3'-cyclic phosphodiesterase/2'nucleotidase/phosphatase [Lautropia sp.]